MHLHEELFLVALVNESEDRQSVALHSHLSPGAMYTDDG